MSSRELSNPFGRHSRLRKTAYSGASSVRCSGVVLVTVVVPTRDRSALLSRALHSLQVQSHRDLEIIVVDDGGADDSAEVVEAMNDPRVRYEWQPNRGACSARNRGMDLARGEYIGFLDSDDEYLPDKIERQLHRFTTAAAEVVGVDAGTIEVTGKDERRVRASVNGQDRRGVLMFRNSAGMTPTILYRARVVRGIRWDENLTAYQDFDFLLRALEHGNIERFDEPLVRVHVHGGERLSDPARQRSAVSRLFRKYASEIESDPAIAAIWHFKLARLHLRVGDRRSASRHFRLAAERERTLKRRLLSVASVADGRLLSASWALYSSVSRISEFVRR